MYCSVSTLNCTNHIKDIVKKIALLPKGATLLVNGYEDDLLIYIFPTISFFLLGKFGY